MNKDRLDLSIVSDCGILLEIQTRTCGENNETENQDYD